VAETLRWDFVGNDRLSDVLESIDKTLGKVDRSLGEFGRKAKAVAGDTAVLEHEVDDLGDKAEKTDRKLQKVFRGLPAEIDAAKLAVKSLSAEFARTGDESILKRITNQKGELRKLENVSKDLFGNVAGEAAKAAVPAAESFASKFAGTLQDNFPSELRGILIVAGVTIGVTLAPLISAAVAAAVLGGVGLGGIIGGVVLAAQDGRVHAAFANMGDEVFTTLKDTASVFIGPLLKVPAIFRAEFAASVPDLRGIFSTLAPEIEPLARGLAGLVREALPGIRRAVSVSAPLINQLARALPEMGRVLSKFFDQMAASGPGAERALLVVIRLIEGAILAVGSLIEAFSKVFDKLAPFSGIFTALSHDTKAFGDAGSDAFGDIGDAASGAASDLNKFSDAFDSALGLNLDLQHATIAYQQAVDDLVTKLKENGRSLDIYTDKGRENREEILRLVEAAERQRQAYIAETGDVKGANAAFAAHIEWLRHTLTQMGYNTDQVNELIAATNQLPRDVKMSFTSEGLGALAQGVANLGQKIANLVGAGGGSIGAIANIGKPKRALGGAVMPGQLYQVNEQQQEYFQPAMPGRITSAPPGGSQGDETVVAPVAINLEGQQIWTGLLTFKRRSGKVSLGLA
jgi:uncharacterized protein YoxC